MTEYVIAEDEYRAAMRKAYEAGAAGREVYSARDYLTRPLVRCRDCKRNQGDCPVRMDDADGYCSLGELRFPPCR